MATDAYHPRPLKGAGAHYHSVPLTSDAIVVRSFHPATYDIFTYFSVLFFAKKYQRVCNETETQVDPEKSNLYFSSHHFHVGCDI